MRVRKSNGGGLSNDPADNLPPLDMPRIKAMLAVIDPDIGRAEWIAIGCALYKHFGHDEGFAVWDEWSSNGRKYKPRRMNTEWRSIAAKDGYDYTIATIIFHANEADPLWWRSKIEEPELIEESELVNEPALVEKPKPILENVRVVMATEPAATDAATDNISDAVPQTNSEQATDSEPAAKDGPVKPLNDLAQYLKTNPTPQPTEVIGFGKKIFSLVCAKDVIIRPKQWLWEGHLLRGAQELLSGLPGLGKSQVQISYIACVTAGLPWPNGDSGMPPANVIMLTAEDTLDQEVVPRLIAAGADLSRVHILKYIRSDGKNNRQFLLGEDLDVLERTVTKAGDVALITIDPITAYMGGKIDSHKTTEVRSQLGPLKDFAEKNNVAVSTITHPAKNTSQKAIDQFIGSQAFIAAGRIGHVCIEEFKGEDGEKTGRILYAHAKHNPTIKKPTLAYRVVEAIIGQDADTHTNIAAPHVVWDKEAVNITADQAVQAASSNGGGKRNDDQKAAQRFLREFLNDGKPVHVTEVYDAGGAHGFSKDQLKRAKQNLGDITVEQSSERKWMWKMTM
jgi:hypothetical protein